MTCDKGDTDVTVALGRGTTRASRTALSWQRNADGQHCIITYFVFFFHEKKNTSELCDLCEHLVA